VIETGGLGRVPGVLIQHGLQLGDLRHQLGYHRILGGDPPFKLLATELECTLPCAGHASASRKDASAGQLKMP